MYSYVNFCKLYDATHITFAILFHFFAFKSDSDTIFHHFSGEAWANFVQCIFQKKRQRPGHTFMNYTEPSVLPSHDDRRYRQPPVGPPAPAYQSDRRAGTDIIFYINYYQKSNIFSKVQRYVPEMV